MRGGGSSAPAPANPSPIRPWIRSPRSIASTTSSVSALNVTDETDQVLLDWMLTHRAGASHPGGNPQGHGSMNAPICFENVYMIRRDLTHSLGGWLGLFWVAALIWAVLAFEREGSLVPGGKTRKTYPSGSPLPEQGRYCTRCQLRHPAGARYCSNCGEAIINN